jgi:hypothetical protein
VGDVVVTRTYVHYFGMDQVAPISAVLADMRLDWDQRKIYIDREAREAGDARIEMALLAVQLLADRVPE